MAENNGLNIKRLRCHAIVVGINSYQNNRKLKNAVADATAIAEKLEGLHFSVKKLINSTRDDFDDAIDLLYDQQFDVVVVYFAGHGMMYSNADYIVFADAARMVKHGGTPAARKSREIASIYKDIRNALPNAMVIAIIDACREDIGEASEDEEEERGVGTQRLEGWTKIPYQTYIAFATSPADTTGDGKNGHSNYTQALLEEIDVLNQPIEITFKNVRRKVFKGHGDHLPWEHSCLVNEFAFNHGQCAPHYYSPYYPHGYNYTLESGAYGKKLSIASKIISDYIKTRSHSLFDPLMDSDAQLPVDYFLLGRAIMDYVLKINNHYPDIIHKDFINALIADNKEDILNGMIYNLYVDNTDKVRNSVPNPEIYQYVHNLFGKDGYSATRKFIEEELKEKIGKEFYLPGSTIIAKFRVNFSENEKNINDARWIYSLDSMTYNGKIIDFFDKYEKPLITYQDFRRELLNISKSPGILLSLSSNIDYIDPLDLIIKGEVSESAIQDILDEYFVSDINSSLDELGHHYEFGEVEDVTITGVDEQMDDLTITGLFTISAIVYLDNEEEIRNDISVDGYFRVDGYLSYDKCREVFVHLNTENLFK